MVSKKTGGPALRNARLPLSSVSESTISSQEAQQPAYVRLAYLCLRQEQLLSALGGPRDRREMGGCRRCRFHWAVILVWEFEESTQDTFQGRCRKEAWTGAPNRCDSQTNFIASQCILHSTAGRQCLCEAQPGHVPSPHKTPSGSRLLLDFGEAWTPKRHSPGLISWTVFALSSSPMLAVDTGPLSVSSNARLLGTSGLCLLCSSSRNWWPAPPPSQQNSLFFLSLAFWFFPSLACVDTAVHLSASQTNVSPAQCLLNFASPHGSWHPLSSQPMLMESMNFKKTNKAK